MACYYPISPLFWADDKTRQWSDPPRLLALYLLTCEHRNLEGLYRLPKDYVRSDLKWSGSKLAGAWKQLEEDEFLSYDADAQVVFVRNAMKYQAPKSGTQITGALKALAAVPRTPLLEAFKAVAAEYAPKFREAMDTPS